MQSQSQSQSQPQTQMQAAPSNREQLANLCKVYIEHLNGNAHPKNISGELEIRFRTGHLSKTDYDNVIKKLKSTPRYAHTTETTHADNYTLKISPEIVNPRTGNKQIDNLRVEIRGLGAIQQYCQSGDNIALPSIQRNMTVIRKRRVGEFAEYKDFQFRAAFSTEERIVPAVVSKIAAEWGNVKKVYRLVYRDSFTWTGAHGRSNMQVDISIVRSSKRGPHGFPMPVYQITDSGVFQADPTYEMEAEVAAKSYASAYADNAHELVPDILAVAKTILSGLQESNYPISQTEQSRVLEDYTRLLYPEKVGIPASKYALFIGPSQRTVQLKNIMPPATNNMTDAATDKMLPTVGVGGERDAIQIAAPGEWCVTEKADGVRRMLFIDSTGRIYFISMQMKISFTGAYTKTKIYFNTLIDGELIMHNKKNKFINRFAAFDMYFQTGDNVRRLPFIGADPKENTRYSRLQKMAINMRMISVVGDAQPLPFTFAVKRFHYDTQHTRMGFYAQCANALDATYTYETDGLVMQSARWGVGATAEGDEGPLKKITWDGAFKWKPPEMNTIDFLVVTKKNAQQGDLVTPLFRAGEDMKTDAQYSQYKTLILHVGYSEHMHGSLNTCDDLLRDDPPSSTGVDDYRAVPFIPSEPYDETASQCHIILTKDNTGVYQMKAEDGDVFSDGMVVEFRYHMDAANANMRWIPIRVRHDKTSEFRQGRKSFGNDYTTANNNWHSIHNPVTETMLRTGEDIPHPSDTENDVYYNTSGRAGHSTRELRQFHNIFVKKRLILGVCKPGDILIDFACGKAGDLPKWIDAKLSLVVGLDASIDSLENRANGACSRYLHARRDRKRSHVPHALFVHADSSRNIRSGQAASTEKGRGILQAVFGSGRVESVAQFPAVKRQQGVARSGFHVASCQFALHYMCKNADTFYMFLQNVAECVKQDGYFIATYYDGQEVYNLLQSKRVGEAYAVYEHAKDKRPIWSVTKQYEQTTFPDDAQSLGMQIDVFQDSINQTIPEYLVNQIFLITEMERYGFRLITDEEAGHMKLPAGTGMFKDFYDVMRQSKDTRVRMTKPEKEISFLNRYSVFKKTHVTDSASITRSLIGDTPASEPEPEQTTPPSLEQMVLEPAVLDQDIATDEKEDVADPDESAETMPVESAVPPSETMPVESAVPPSETMPVESAVPPPPSTEPKPKPKPKTKKTIDDSRNIMPTESAMPPTPSARSKSKTKKMRAMSRVTAQFASSAPTVPTKKPATTRKARTKA